MGAFQIYNKVFVFAPAVSRGFFNGAKEKHIFPGVGAMRFK